MQIREATPDDLEALLDHLRGTFGEDDRARVTDLLSTREGASRWLLAVDDGNVVSCSARLHHRLHLDGVDLDAVQIEWVATAESHRRRGLVRAMFSEHHRIADPVADVMFVAGIPYLYRRFGYGYGLDPPIVVALPPTRGAAAFGAEQSAGGGSGPSADASGTGRSRPGLRVRTATLGDLDALVAVGDASTPVRIVRDAQRWHQRLRTTDAGVEETLVVEEETDGAGVPPRAWARLQTYPADGEQYLIWGSACDEEAALALIDHAAGLVPPGLRLYAYGGSGAWVQAALRRGSATEPGNGYYARFPDPVRLLRRLVPVLDRRLADAGRHDTGPLTISCYDRSIHLALHDGRVAEVDQAPGIEDPFDSEDVGVAPDLLPALFLGRWGAAGLAERYDDVALGRYAELMAVLFPRLEADIADDL